ncbi:MAG: beta-galactosidase [Clostridiales bacterium]|jgi:hypothetical protein|nr:beta-galactosidase [Clostridiales bacterium]
MGVSFENKNIVIDGRPTTVFSGEFQYFRTDPGDWRDRLEKLKAMGLNAIGIYFPWNYHSDRPGEADFTAPQRDVSRLLDMAREMGLHVTARPGPYICNEWDLGGYPGWLLDAPSGDWRTAHPDHLRWCRQWYRAVNAVLAPQQRMQGGPIILYQIENEHFWGEKGLFESLADYAAEDGIRVPLVGNHEGSVYKVGARGIADGIDIYTPVWEHFRWRGWLDRMKNALPEEAPLMVLEYMGAIFCTWGDSASDEARLPSRWVAMQAMLFLAKGANLTNFFVAVGGMNPPGLGSDHSCTNYMADAAVSHWGGLGRKFYEMRLLAEAVHAFSEALSLSKPWDIGWGTDNANVECLARRGPKGAFYFAFNNTVRAQHYRIRLPGGRALPEECPLRLAPKSAAMFAADVPLTERLTLAFCTAPLFRIWRAGDDVHIIACDEAGAPCRLELLADGEAATLDAVCSDEVRAAALRCSDCQVRLYAVTPAVAERTWFAPGERGDVPMFTNLPLVRPGLGADGRLRAEAEAGQPVDICAPCAALTAGGKAIAGEARCDGLTRFRFAAPAAGGPEFIWGKPEYRAEGDAWRQPEAPLGEGWRPVGPFDGHGDSLPGPGSYEYATDFDVEDEAPQSIAFTGITGVEARFYLNGRRLGVFPERRPGAYHPLPHMDAEFPVDGILRRGRNRLTVSCELIGRHNLGRPIYAGINRPAVLMGHPAELPIAQWKEHLQPGQPLEMAELQAVPPQALPGCDDASWRALDVAAPRNLPPDEFSGWHDVRWYRAKVQVPGALRGRPLFLRLPKVSEAWVYADGTPAGYVSEHLSSIIDLSAHSDREEIALAVALRYLNWMRPWALLEAPVLFAAHRVLRGWQLRKGSQGERQGWLESGEGWQHSPPPATDARLWYRREIAVRRPAGLIAPVYVELDEGWKSYAKVYWNGQPIGLYADVGPDRQFYVPDRLIRENNQIAVSVDGYHSLTACGGTAMGAYERRVPVALRLEAGQ